MTNLVLIGFMGVGKSTIGKLCARQIGYRFQDSDTVLEKRLGCSVQEFFAAQGEAAFRAAEREVIAELSATSNLVIATGGGAVLQSENAERLRVAGLMVLLTAAPDIIRKRVGDATSRPLLASAPDVQERIQQLLMERQPHYEQVAHIKVDTTDRRPADVATEVVNLWRIRFGIQGKMDEPSR